jgi:hypothetical protein
VECSLALGAHLWGFAVGPLDFEEEVDPPKETEEVQLASEE